MNPLPELDAESPCACRLTPVGRGAVATVAVQGAGIAELVGRLATSVSGKPLGPTPRGRILLALWHGGNRPVEPLGDDVVVGGVGEEVVLAFLGPRQVEIHCHGGRAASARILDDLRRHGCPSLDWDDWAARTMSPLARQAAMELTRASTQRVAAILLDQFHGALDRQLNEIATLIDQRQHDSARRQLAVLQQRSALGRRLTHPWIVVIAGRPNVGKSSLINAIVGYRRALVYDQPGTTRDALTALTAVDGWPVELIDTAGLRESQCAIESAGVQRARRHAERADLVLLVADVSRAWNEEDADLLVAYPRALLVHNKMDLLVGDQPGDDRPPGLLVSAKAERGLAELLAEVSRRLVPVPPAAGEAIPFCDPLADAVEQTAAAADKGDWTTALATIERTRAGSGRL